jgi:hypothetical protein
MQISKTTLAGTIGAASAGGSQVPGIPEWLSTTLKLVAAACFAILGRFASDCPRGCPGTDATGHPNPWQRGLFSLVMAALCVGALAAALIGCVSKSPPTVAGAPAVPAYVVSPSLTVASNTAVGVATVSGEATGSGPLFALATNGIFAAIGALSLLWARHKSAVAGALANGVVKAGPGAVNTVLASASDGPKFAAVSQALNEQLSAGQAPGQPAPEKKL